MLIMYYKVPNEHLKTMLDLIGGVKTKLVIFKLMQYNANNE